ncbi:putative eukaryotic translation initiation factor 5-1 [Dorcoceras hygrometricum]|uniref:Putative eukaryotic translation initiation factor 5-1 n=1 Tax=Dorcoceras hygrometricum TaxID=472368 RepID=A0A2Z7ALH8_9LAMI|nr:putative eukaryotic translation initiation factor 5-1 [Dorcoceras hygrometricum]
MRDKLTTFILKYPPQKHPSRRNPNSQMRTIRHLVARKMRMKAVTVAGESDDDVEWQIHTSSAAA